MKSLILAEKPSVAREIARVLGCHEKNKSYIEGPNYVVTWALGHLVGLAEPEDYDARYQSWKIEDLPIVPQKRKLKILKETSHQFRAISQLAKRKDFSQLIIATDAGREGELVARWIMEMVHWKKPFKRLWISSQTDKAIKEGFARLKPGKEYDNLFASAVCRAEADWLVGLNCTRALTCKYNEPLSAGRVQTPTLSMIVEREREISAFRPVPYWILSGKAGPFIATWRKDEKGEQRIFSEEEGKSLFTSLDGKMVEVIKVQRKEKSEPHPLAYDLTELQRDANQRYHFSAKQTLNIMQRLYESHKLVTYPRTDSRHLTTDMVDTLKDRLERIEVGPYAQLVRPLLKKNVTVSKRVVDDSKVTDHHAIIPTEQPVYIQDLSSDEQKIYDLIVRRFISLFYPPYESETLTVSLEVEGERMVASGNRILQLGWKEVYPSSNTRLEGELPAVKEGDQWPIKNLQLKKEFISPPDRYNEASLLTRMEKYNLGTPATRADIIEKLLKSDSIERRQNQLCPTKKGLQLVELVVKDLRSPELTTRWENQLEAIARGKGEMETFLSGIVQETNRIVAEVKNSKTEYKPHNITGSRCPDCGEFLKEVNGKRGKMLVCSSNECSYRRSTEKQLSNKRCPQCHKKMEIRNGKAGKFFQCKSCNVVEKLNQEAGKGKGRINKHQERNLINQYSTKENFQSSLGDALKAALTQKKED